MKEYDTVKKTMRYHWLATLHSAYKDVLGLLFKRLELDHRCDHPNTYAPCMYTTCIRNAMATTPHRSKLKWMGHDIPYRPPHPVQGTWICVRFTPSRAIRTLWSMMCHSREHVPAFLRHRNSIAPKNETPMHTSDQPSLAVEPLIS